MKNKAGLTYAGAGVDIEVGNAVVEKIKPLVRATRRPGADAEIGGFGGNFDLKAAGENPVPLGRVVAIEAGERVVYSGRLAL